jgi:hypothetical protein
MLGAQARSSGSRCSRGSAVGVWLHAILGSTFLLCMLEPYLHLGRGSNAVTLHPSTNGSGSEGSLSTPLLCT